LITDSVEGEDGCGLGVSATAAGDVDPAGPVKNAEDKVS